jgi:beta-lactamase class A
MKLGYRPNRPRLYSLALTALLLRMTLVTAMTVPLTQSKANPLDEKISDLVRSFRGVMGIVAVDLQAPRSIAVNADVRFPTASTIKTAVMVEAYHQISEGALALDTTFTLRDADKVGGSGVLNGLHDGLQLTARDLIHLMIVLSDNTATNMLIARLGTARVNARLERYGLRETKLFRPTFRDGRADVLPELEREFGLGVTTPREMARLMELIAEGKAVDAKSSEAMRATLARQQDRAMIPRLLPAGVTVANKTGTDEEKHPGPDGNKRHVRADAAIVSGPNCRYVIAIYARQIEDRRWSVENEALTTGARISSLVHEAFCGATR